ncbi:MAG: GHMP kinase [Alphaproteobacteria bacterium]|jgi:D-glycero-alpha-D-manno-heptose-7-phosphate kinase
MTPNGKYITTCTPLRVSFAGGGTDLPEYYEKGYGAVFSTAIDKHLYVTLKPLSPIYGINYRLNYSQSEQAQCIDEIENAIARECLRLVEVEPPLYIGTVADLPAYSGLGSSSSFAVGLLHALHAYRGERVSSGHIAEEAAHVEIEVLKRPMGKQDHFAAAFGGLNYIRFRNDGGVSIEPQNINASKVDKLFDNVLLFWTGLHRDSSEVLTEQRQNVDDRTGELEAMREQAMSMRDVVCNGFDIHKFGALLDEGWVLKQRLASSITNDRITNWYRRAKQAGAIGGKLCGAGGGGFLLFVAEPSQHDAIRAALSDLTEVDIGYEPRGSRVLVTVND